MSELEQIEARLEAATPGAITITPSDVNYLLTLARKQAAALERVEFLAGWWQEDFPHKACLIRDALKEKP